MFGLSFFEDNIYVVILIFSIIILSLGATIVSYANSLLSVSAVSSDPSSDTKVTVIRNIGALTTFVGVILIVLYGYKVFVKYDIRSRFQGRF
jgi:ascorbate-specific PTS system EIIC-type component UlaA